MKVRPGWFAVVPAVIVVGLTLIGPWLAAGDPGYIAGLPYSRPVAGLPLGTDYSGRDVLLRVLAGGQPLLLIPLAGVVLTAIIGSALGIAAGYLGGAVDAVVSRLDYVLLAVPPVLVLLILLHGWGYSALTLIAVVILTGAPFVSRVARAATRQVIGEGYVEQAVCLGESTPAILVREILPSIVRPILADAGSRLAIAIGVTASAGFLGFGPDTPNWGAMISQNMEGITLTPWGVAVPAACLATLAITANLTLDRLATRIGP